MDELEVEVAAPKDDDTIGSQNIDLESVYEHDDTFGSHTTIASNRHRDVDMNMLIQLTPQA